LIKKLSWDEKDLHIPADMNHTLFRNCLAGLILLLTAKAGANSPGNPEDQPRKRPSVGLVLSGGGARGFAYIGLLRVIRETGLPIDYIGGSSIGSIIGGLYALGYDPDTIAKMIRSEDWNKLLKDVVDRRYIAFEEKEYGENSIIRLPIRNKKLGLGAAMYQGQEINILLNYYFSPAYKTTDFRKLQTPFLCIGTNLLTGDEVVLDKGYLPMAIRASMSIPGYFSPTEYMGYYMVDGGVVNNYPVREVKDMGAEIILGGDVQSGLDTTREQLSSITEIADQITSFACIQANKVGDSLTNLKVRFKMDYGILDFDQYDSIMALGERVARSHYREIKALADSLNAIEYRPLKKYTTRPLESFYVDSIIIRGNKKMSRKYFTSLFEHTKNTDIKISDLQKNIRKIYGSGFFEHVFYEFEQDKNKTNLVIDASEAGPGALAAGIHFDNDYGAGLILSGSFRNILGRNSKIFADVNISVDPHVRVVYLLGLGGKAAFGLSGDFYNFNFNEYEKSVKINQIIFINNKGTLFFQYAFKNMVNLKAGFDYEYFRFSQNIQIDSTLNPYEKFTGYGTAFLSLMADSRDRPYFPNRGVLATLRSEYTMPLSGNWSKDIFADAAAFYLKFDQSIPLSHRFVLQPGLFAGGAIWAENIPPLQHGFGLGGLSPRSYIDQYVSFTGLQFIQKFGYYSAVARLKLQYNVYKNLYLTMRSDAGAAEEDFQELFASRNFLWGYGVTASYNSIIGPVELTLMGSNLNPGIMLFVNLGFNF
jgi:NTE family protein